MDRNKPFAIEKVFFEFDCEKNPNLAVEEALTFAKMIRYFYHAESLICLSGLKGAHVYLWLQQSVEIGEHFEYAKDVYPELQNILTLGFSPKTLDPHVIGDLKRLSRLPYPIHEKSGLEKLKRTSKRAEIREGEIRPCIREALTKPLHGGAGHLMRLAIACEYLAAGYSVDEIVPLFQNQSDFNERKTRYFIEHAQKNNYKPFKCKKIREIGFCLEEKCPLQSKKRGRGRFRMAGKKRLEKAFPHSF